MITSDFKLLKGEIKMNKKGIILITILLIGVSIFCGYYNAKLAEAKTPSWFWSLSPTTRLMVNTVHAEAKGEPYLAKVAVAAVMMNRVRSHKFPNTIAGVIYQPWAFTPVAHGLVWSQRPTEDSIRATLSAIRGWDPTYGCLYFYNPATSTSRWIYSRRTVRKIGKHIFAR